MWADAVRHFIAESDKFWIWGLPGVGRNVTPIRPAVQPAGAPDERADREDPQLMRSGEFSTGFLTQAMPPGPAPCW